VFRPESRIASEDLIPGRTLCQVIENHGDGNSSASGAKIAATNSGVAAEAPLPDRPLTIVSRRQQPLDGGVRPSKIQICMTELYGRKPGLG
jgi:hypothetical protein